MRRHFEAKTVLITGAARGIGRSTAEAFAEQGAILALSDLDGQALEATATALREEGAEVHTWVLDVSDREAVQAMAAELLERLGHLDILVNNAGIGHMGPLAETDLETWERLLAVDWWGVLYHVYAFLPHFMERGEGHIVNVSTGQAFFRMPTWGAYAAVKAGMAAFSEISHFELRKHGVHVTTVYPFMALTGFYEEIEGESWGARLSMRLLPLYSQTPDKVGRILVRAVRRRKRSELVHVLNDVGYYLHLAPRAHGLVCRLTDRVLTGRAA